MTNDLKTVAYENINYIPFTDGVYLLNYIFLSPENELLILSTYYKSKFKYYAKLKTSPENLDLLINHLKQVTWTIDEHKTIKTTVDNIPINIKKYLSNKVIFDIINIGVVSGEFKAFLINLHREHIKKRTYKN